MFMNYRERFECLKLSEGFEFVVCANHQIELRCKKCGCTWDNVQIAHRICNSNKRDYIGKEWNNGDFKEE